MIGPDTRHPEPKVELEKLAKENSFHKLSEVDMGKFKNFLSGVALGTVVGVVATIIFAPDKRTEWLDEIQEKTQDILVEFNRAAQEYREEMEKDLEKRRQSSD